VGERLDRIPDAVPGHSSRRVGSRRGRSKLPQHSVQRRGPVRRGRSLRSLDVRCRLRTTSVSRFAGSIWRMNSRQRPHGGTTCTWSSPRQTATIFAILYSRAVTIAAMAACRHRTLYRGRCRYTHRRTHCRHSSRCHRLTVRRSGCGRRSVTAREQPSWRGLRRVRTRSFTISVTRTQMPRFLGLQPPYEHLRSPSHASAASRQTHRTGQPSTVATPTLSMSARSRTGCRRAWGAAGCRGRRPARRRRRR